MKNNRLDINNVINKLNNKNIYLLDSNNYIGTHYKTRFICHCGNIFECMPSSILYGNTTSCGCYKRKKVIEKHIVDLTNKRFGKLLVIKLIPKTLYPSKEKRKYLCKCDCGNESVVLANSLLSGNTKSCGCLQIELTKLRKGINHPSYNKNLTDEDRKGRRLPEHEKWRKLIFKRDSYVCQICGYGGKINAHHIYSYGYFTELRFTMENGITLCKDCHQDFHYMYGNKYNTLDELWEYINDNN